VPNLSDRLVDELLAPAAGKHFKEGGISEIVQSATAEMQLVDFHLPARGQLCNYPAAFALLDSVAAPDPAIALLSCPTLSAMPHL